MVMVKDQEVSVITTGEGVKFLGKRLLLLNVKPLHTVFYVCIYLEYNTFTTSKSLVGSIIKTAKGLLHMLFITWILLDVPSIQRCIKGGLTGG
jgi:hypothetical protein